MDKEKKDMLKGAAIGAIAGIIAGILAAPKSGKETREDLKKHYMEMKETILEKIDALKDVTQEEYENIIGQVVSSYKDKKKITEEEAEEVKKKLKEAFDEIQRKSK